MICADQKSSYEKSVETKGRPIGKSKRMLEVFDQARQFATSSAPVLLQGESGTGKEVIARLIHTSSKRSREPYVRVNCAALSASLIESELFGHERGAFTGATEKRIGRIECAAQGTLLLDEISEIPMNLQAKLLRVLEEGEYQRVGGNESRSIQARIIATSNRDLTAEVERNSFREDLFYRLNVLQLRVPALRERREDIPLLLDFFAESLRIQGESVVEAFDSDAINRLCNYDWPGNVRQLRNETHRMCVLTTSKVIRGVDIEIRDSNARIKQDNIFEMSLRDAERSIIESAILRYHGNKTKAASHLGITTRTIRNKLNAYRAMASGQ